ncbi:MAG: hypothetical protein MZU97_18235 [Bacillus subtilis]|nr:hypothetical protein [Bacillus subtilis]
MEKTHRRSQSSFAEDWKSLTWNFGLVALNDIALRRSLYRVRVFKDNMDKQFLRLFGVDNLHHLFVAVDEFGVVRSSLAYYSTKVQLFESELCGRVDRFGLYRCGVSRTETGFDASSNSPINPCEAKTSRSRSSAAAAESTKPPERR